MKSIKLWLAGMMVVLAAGCATESGYDARPKEAPPEPPLPEIPEYPAIGEVSIPTGGIAVYPTLWYHELLKEALSKVGYRVMEAQGADGGMVTLPARIVEPVSFKHSQEVRAGETWLYTRIVVQVRRPLVALADGDGFEAGEPVRIFQAYARTNLGKISAVDDDSRRENIKTAIDHLMQVRQFRAALN